MFLSNARCPTKLFYGQLIEWLNVKNASSLSPSPFEIPFGMLSSSLAFDAKVRKLGYTLLFAKCYIYCKKINDSALNFDRSLSPDFDEFELPCFYRRFSLRLVFYIYIFSSPVDVPFAIICMLYFFFFSTTVLHRSAR